jgi:hypothetical protein
MSLTVCHSEPLILLPLVERRSHTFGLWESHLAEQPLLHQQSRSAALCRSLLRGAASSSDRPLSCHAREILDVSAQSFAMERSIGALTVLPPSWVHVSVPSSRESQPITSSVNSALPKMVTRSYGGSPTLGSHVSEARRIDDWMYSQS